MATYSSNSPYYQTSYYGKFLDLMTPRIVVKNAADTIYIIDAVYTRRPDHLAFDLYGDSGLWWVFAARNPDIIQDPVFDFVAGTTIYVPSKKSLDSSLGL